MNPPKDLLTEKYKALSESAFQKKVLKYLKQNDFYFFKVVRSSRSGTPDIIACRNGIFVGIEVKKETGRLSPLQKKHRSEIKHKKGLHFTVKPSTFDLFMSDVIKFTN